MMEMQIVDVCCQNEGAGNFILAGIGILQLAIAHCIVSRNHG